MSVALLLKALGGFYLATYPELSSLRILYGFWGFTTIFLFWAAMIKATRIWGGANKQGTTFGYLDGGRVLMAAIFGSLGVLVFSLFITKDVELTSIEERRTAFKQVIKYTAVAVSIISILVFLFLKNLNASEEKIEIKTKSLTISNFKKVIQYKAVWLLIVIILYAYFGYKMIDLFSQYA